MALVNYLRILAGSASVLVVVSAAVSLESCGEPADTSRSQAAGGPAQDAAPLTGNERFGWTESADSVAGYHFAVYADGARIELPGAACRPVVSGHAECDAPLPHLEPGRHTLEVVSWVLQDGRVVESAKAPPIVVVIADHKEN